jgi:lipopolysaccharide/colanic/teichoic acid biosynthesis glycosyltransferase
LIEVTRYAMILTSSDGESEIKVARRPIDTKPTKTSPFLALMYRQRPAFMDVIAAGAGAGLPACCARIWQRTERLSWLQRTMKHRLIRAWFDFRSRRGVEGAGCGADGSASSKGPTSAFLLQRATKRAFDIVVAAAGLVFFSPIWLLASLAIKIDSRGPILCRQARHGYGNEEFQMFAFRCTRIENIDEVLHAARKGAGVTRIGRALRSSGIAGLPQLINVLRGEMSIVGPRPYTNHPGGISEDLVLRISRQHKIKPGLVGWTQVGYGDGSNSFAVMRRRIEHDLHYIENWSLLLDMKIILMALSPSRTHLPAE